MDAPFDGAAFELAPGRPARATRYRNGGVAGPFDPTTLFPGHPAPARIVDHDAGVVGPGNHPYDGDVHWQGFLDGAPFDGLLVDRADRSPFVTLTLFRDGTRCEMREIGRNGILNHLEFTTPEGWDVAYGWHVDASLLWFRVRADGDTIHLESREPGALTTTRFDLDAPLFERMARSDAFVRGFPRDPADPGPMPPGSFVAVQGRFMLAERLAALSRRPGLDAVERWYLAVPAPEAFEALEALVLAIGSGSRVTLNGPDDRREHFLSWFERRNGPARAAPLSAER